MSAFERTTEPCLRPGCVRRTDGGAPFCCHPCRVAEYRGLEGERRGDHSDLCTERFRSLEPSHVAGETQGCGGVGCSAQVALDRKFCCNPCRQYARAVRLHKRTPPPVVIHSAKCLCFAGLRKVHS